MNLYKKNQKVKEYRDKVKVNIKDNIIKFSQLHKYEIKGEKIINPEIYLNNASNIYRENNNIIILENRYINKIKNNNLDSYVLEKKINDNKYNIYKFKDDSNNYTMKLLKDDYKNNIKKIKKCLCITDEVIAEDIYINNEINIEDIHDEIL